MYNTNLQSYKILMPLFTLTSDEKSSLTDHSQFIHKIAYDFLISWQLLTFWPSCIIYLLHFLVAYNIATWRYAYLFFVFNICRADWAAWLHGTCQVS